jgi:uncharacterized protein (TIGR00730 family)
MSEDPHPSAAQAASPTYRLASADPDFIMGPSMRGVRFLMEFAKPDEALRSWGVRSTIVVFGSARIREDGSPDHQRWYAAARAFGAIASKRGGAHLSARHERHNVICTGGGPGIMEAANRGAQDVGAPSIGLNITLPHEQYPNSYSTPELTFRFHYFAMRKMHFAMRANALVVFPGGFGTLDELFEGLTLAQTRKVTSFPVVLFGTSYWSGLADWLRETMLADGKISAADLDMFTVTDDVDEAISYIVKAGEIADAAAEKAAAAAARDVAEAETPESRERREARRLGSDGS